MNDKWITFIASMIGFVVTGLVYTLVSFSYIQSSFATKLELSKDEERITRVEDRLKSDINDIHTKLDAILLRMGGN